MRRTWDDETGANAKYPHCVWRGMPNRLAIGSSDVDEGGMRPCRSLGGMRAVAPGQQRFVISAVRCAVVLGGRADGLSSDACADRQEQQHGSQRRT